MTISNSLASRLSASLGNSLNGGGVAAPVADAGADDTHDQVTTPAYTLAGSATGGGSITYLWEKVSGPGTVTFVDDEDPESDVAFEWPGAYVLKLTATNDAGSDEDEVTIVVTAPLASLLTLMGAGTQFLYDVGASSETLNGSNYSQLNDLGPSARHATQATAGNQPAKDATGGPLGDACIAPQAATRYLQAGTGLAIATNQELFFIAVVKTPAAGLASMCAARDTGNNNVFNAIGDGSNFRAAVKCNTGAETASTFTSPVHTTDWRAWTTLFATGATPATAIGLTAATPGYATITGTASNIHYVWLGNAAASGGKVKLLGCFSGTTAAKRLAARQYMYGRTGLESS